MSILLEKIVIGEERKINDFKKENGNRKSSLYDG